MLTFPIIGSAFWPALAVAIVLCAGLFGHVLFQLRPDARAGMGARHRSPGLPRVTPSGTYPRRRAEPERDYAEALGMAGYGAS
jgi:hypothetical protein